MYPTEELQVLTGHRKHENSPFLHSFPAVGAYQCHALSAWFRNVTVSRCYKPLTAHVDLVATSFCCSS